MSAFPCPRCGAYVVERFYGPCGACRCDLAELATSGPDPCFPVEQTTIEGNVRRVYKPQPTCPEHGKAKARPAPAVATRLTAAPPDAVTVDLFGDVL